MSELRVASKTEAINGVSNNTIMTPLRVKEAISSRGPSPTPSGVTDVKQNGVSIVTDGVASVTVPTKVSDLTNDSGFITTESDPVFSASPAHNITSANISSWSGKSTVTFTPSLTGGTKVGDLTIDGTTTSLYAPTSSQVPVYFLKNDGSAADLAIINEVCAKYDSNEDFLVVGTFSDYESGKVFKAPMSVVRYNDERDEAMSFTTPLINLTDDSSSSYKEHYIQMALFFEGTWGAYTYSGSYRLSTLTPDDKQDKLVSGQNIKTINSQSILGSGDIQIQGGGADEVYIQSTEPTDEDWKLWVDPSEPSSSFPSEVINSMAGSETSKAPSVAAVKGVLPTKTSDLTNDSHFAVTNSDNNFSSNQTFDKEIIAGQIRSKNMFDVNNLILNSGSLTINNNSFVVSGSKTWCYSYYVKILPAGTYTISGTMSGSQQFVEFYKNNIWVSGLGLPSTFTLTETTEIKFVFYATTTESSGSTTFTNFQLEEGSTATEYYPHQNLNGEEIYSTEEIRIGTLFGKPLYRKSIQFTTSSTTYSMISININTSNIETAYITNPSFVVSSTDSCTYMINATRATSNSAIQGDVNMWARINSTKTQINYVCGSITANSKATITLEYTKTTD